jgi:hypothetical protein
MTKKSSSFLRGPRVPIILMAFPLWTVLNIHVLSFFVTTRFFSPFCIVKFLSFNMNIVRFIIFVAFAIYIPTNGLRKPNEAFFIEIYQHPN